MRDKRLRVYQDIFENSFIVRTTEYVFARINKIADKWCVWFYKNHVQKDFNTIREALINVECKFLELI